MRVTTEKTIVITTELKKKKKDLNSLKMTVARNQNDHKTRVKASK